MKYKIILTLLFYMLTNIKCDDSDIDSPENWPEKCIELCSEIGGICSNDLVCKCKKSYTTFYKDYLNDFILCNYKQYNKFFAGFLELFLGCGFGHLYCRRYFMGYLKLMLEPLSYCFLLCSVISSIVIMQEITAVPLSLSVLLIIFLIWKFADCYLFISGYYKDGNDIPLY